MPVILRFQRVIRFYSVHTLIPAVVYVFYSGALLM